MFKKDGLSVIIPAFDTHDITVVHARESMMANRTPDEVIVVNDGGTPDLYDMLKKMYERTDKRCPLVYARINENIEWNYVGAVNLGAWLAKSYFLAFEDGDNIPYRDFYEKAIDLIKKNPSCKRVVAQKRIRIWKDTALKKPFNGWKQEKYSIGPNMGTNMMTKDVIRLLKGQDERHAGAYGWMFIDWRHRMLAKAKIDFGAVGLYWYIMDGQSNLSRRKSSKNLSIRRENARLDRLHSPHGMLNFTYDYEVFS